MRTVFRSDRFYQGLEDTEIRGFLDGEVKFERNVATQYHVRIGCEGSGPLKGRYEVMRLLQRWDISSLPPYASIDAARLILHQEDCSIFPHRYPLRWPVDFYLYIVRKPWGAGKGGVGHDNLSSPERGDAWWMDSQAGESSWTVPGCSYASDTDADADRSAQALAWARIHSAKDRLCFTGPLLTKHLEDVLRSDGRVSFLIKASQTDECLPGSIKTFFSAEFGDHLSPELRPRLELDWTATCMASEVRPFILEPGANLTFKPDFPEGSEDGEPGTLAASIETEACCKQPSLQPEIHTEGWTEASSPAGEASSAPPSPVSLRTPVAGLPGPDLCVRVSTAVNPILLGENFSTEIRETWTPSASRPESLEVAFRLMAPSRRTVELQAEYRGNYLYGVDFQPDELGIWSYEWRARPDIRFEEQSGQGFFTVLPHESLAEEGPALVNALRTLVKEASREAHRRTGIVARHSNQFRLIALQRDIRLILAAEQGRDPEGSTETALELRRLLRDVASALGEVE